MKKLVATTTDESNRIDFFLAKKPYQPNQFARPRTKRSFKNLTAVMKKIHF